MATAKTKAAPKAPAKTEVKDDAPEPIKAEVVVDDQAAQAAAAPVAPPAEPPKAAEKQPEKRVERAKPAPRPVESVNARLAAGRNGSLDRELRPLLEAMVADHQALADAVNKLLPKDAEQVHLRVGK